MPDWAQLIAEAEKSREAPVLAETFRRDFPTGNRPVLLACDDENEYVVKSRHYGPSIVTDHIVGRLGRFARLPVGQPSFVAVPQALIDEEPKMAHMQPGVAHASLWMPGCSEQMGFDHMDKPANRIRFAQLALLYGWLGGSDHQFIYEDDEPRLVHSVDHNGFFSGWVGWAPDEAKTAVPDPNIVTTCGLTGEELEAGRKAARPVSDSEIATAVAAPLDEWGITRDVRVAAAIYASARRDVVFAAPEGSA